MKITVFDLVRMRLFSWAWGGLLALSLVGSAFASDGCHGFQQIRGCVEWHGEGAPHQPWYNPHNPKDQPQPAEAPEPEAWLLIAAGVVSLAWARRTFNPKFPR